MLAVKVPTDVATLLRETTASLFDGNALMDLCFDRKMRCFDGESGTRMIAAKRVTRLKQVEQEAAEMAQRRALADKKRKERAAAAAAAAAAEAEMEEVSRAAEPELEGELEGEPPSRQAKLELETKTEAKAEPALEPEG
jgi:hypothetical protein